MTARATDLERSSGPDWRWAFLGALAKSGSVVEACLAAGVSRPCAYRHRARFPRFRAKWDEALEVSVELLEAFIRGRAFDKKDPASAPLSMFILKARKPEYRDSFRPGPAAEDVDVTKLSDDELQALIDSGKGR